MASIATLSFGRLMRHKPNPSEEQDSCLHGWDGACRIPRRRHTDFRFSPLRMLLWLAVVAYLIAFWSFAISGLVHAVVHGW